MGNGSRVVLQGEGDHENKDHVAGDVIIVVMEAKHEVFVRKGVDLYTEMKVSISCQFKKC